MLEGARNRIIIALACVMAATAIGGCSAKTPADSGTDAAITQFASGGVAVMEDVRSTAPIVATTGPASAMRFTRWQLRNLLAEAAANDGYEGKDLDALAPIPAGSPAFSTLLTAWLKRAQGPLAQAATAGVTAPANGDPATTRFPTLTVLLFVADIARPKTVGLLHSFDFTPLIASWVASLVNNITSAISANGGWLSSLLSSVVAVVGRVITGIEQTVLTYVTRIATVTATLMQVASMFKPWTVTMKPDPATVTIDDATHAGTFTATLNAEPIPWPQTLKDCVSQLTNGAVNLNDEAYKDAPITWSDEIGIPALATNTTKDATLQADKTAKYAYTTITASKPGDDDCPRLVPDGTIGVTATVARADIAKVVNSLEGLIVGLLPGALQSYVKPFVQPAFDAAAQTASQQFKAPSGKTTVAVSTYVADPLCSHTPPPGPSAQPTQQQHAASGALPGGPCQNIITSGDVSDAYRDGSNLIPPTPEYEKAVAAMWSAMRDVGQQMGKDPTNPRMENASYCVIGIQTGTDANGQPDGDMHGAFIVMSPPAPALQMMTPDPQCRALIGPALDHFGATCLKNPEGMLIVADAHTEWDTADIKGTPENSYRLLTDIMHRLAP
jgi:hypothetical protein